MVFAPRALLKGGGWLLPLGVVSDIIIDATVQMTCIESSCLVSICQLLGSGDPRNASPGPKKLSKNMVLSIALVLNHLLLTALEQPRKTWPALDIAMLWIMTCAMEVGVELGPLPGVELFPFPPKGKGSSHP